MTRGFTVLELAIIIGLLAFLGGIGLVVTFESYRGSNFHSDRDLLVTVLQHARSDALASVCRAVSCSDALPHGVRIEAGRYIVFEGSSYVASDPQNQTFAASPAVVKSGEQEFVFAPSTGSLLYPSITPATVILSGEGRASTVSVDAEGQISWTH